MWKALLPLVGVADRCYIPFWERSSASPEFLVLVELCKGVSKKLIPSGEDEGERNRENWKSREILQLGIGFPVLFQMRRVTSFGRCAM